MYQPIPDYRPKSRMTTAVSVGIGIAAVMALTGVGALVMRPDVNKSTPSSLAANPMAPAATAPAGPDKKDADFTSPAPAAATSSTIAEAGNTPAANSGAAQGATTQAATPPALADAKPASDAGKIAAADRARDTAKPKSARVASNDKTSPPTRKHKAKSDTLASAAAKTDSAAKTASAAAATTATATMTDTAADSAPAAESQAAICGNCGKVEAVDLVQPKAQSAAGGMPDAASSGDGSAQASADGNPASYRIRVRMEDGSQRVVYQNDSPSVAIGDHVKIVDGAIVRQS